MIGQRKTLSFLLVAITVDWLFIDNLLEKGGKIQFTKKFQSID